MKNFFAGVFVFLILLNLTASASASVEADIADFKANREKIYDTKGHPKAKGLRLTMPYPPSWIAKEGERPNIVQKFLKIDEGRIISSGIHIIEVPPNEKYTSVKINSEPFRKSLVEKMGSNIKYLDSGATQVEGEDAFWIFYLQEFSLPAGKISLFFLSYSVYFAGKHLLIMHSVGGSPDDPTLRKTFDKYSPLFQLMTTRVIFPEKWSRSR